MAVSKCNKNQLVYSYGLISSLGSRSLGLGDSEVCCCPVAIVAVPSGVALQPGGVVADLVLAWGIRSLSARCVSVCVDMGVRVRG